MSSPIEIPTPAQLEQQLQREADPTLQQWQRLLAEAIRQHWDLKYDQYFTFPIGDLSRPPGWMLERLQSIFQEAGWELTLLEELHGGDYWRCRARRNARSLPHPRIEAQGCPDR